MESVELSKKEAHDLVVFLTCFIKGLICADAELKKEYKEYSFLVIQKLLPPCEWEDGEEKCMITSREQLERFL
ncbi:MAG: hypothetical protein IKW21_06615 [Lachnospiraceae bacterium]|nr:hypothetical protein [Lachnospiraceae bacterium]